MLGSIWNFMKRHKKKIIFTGVLVGGVVYLGRYARRKVQELQEKEAADCLTQARRQHHFDSNQRTCNMTALSMLPGLREAIMRCLDAESLTAQLKHRPSNKLEIWEELKIISFTRSLVAVYSCCMLIVMLRVQLNIIGGYMYVDTLHTNTAEGETSSSQVIESRAVTTPQVQQRYLALVQHLLNEGLTELTAAVKEAVHQVLDNIPLKQSISLHEVQELIRVVRNQVERHHSNSYQDNHTHSMLSRYMLQQEDSVEQAQSLSRDDLLLVRLRQETRDMLDSGDFHSILTLCLETGFIRLVDKLSEYFKVAPSDNGVIINPNQLSLPLAKVIPVMTGLVHTVVGDPPNTLVQELLLKDQVKDFAANIYEAFSQPTTTQDSNHHHQSPA